MQKVNSGNAKKIQIDTRVAIAIRCAVFALVVLAICAAIFFSLEKNLVASISAMSTAAIEKALLSGPDLQVAAQMKILKLRRAIDSKLHRIMWLHFGFVLGAGVLLTAGMLIIMKKMLVIPVKFVRRIQPVIPKADKFPQWLHRTDQSAIDADPENWLKLFLATLESLLEGIATDGSKMKEDAEKLTALAGEMTAKIRQTVDKNSIFFNTTDSETASLPSDMADIVAVLDALAATTRKTADSFRILKQVSEKTRKITANAVSHINRVVGNAESYNNKISKIGSIMDLVARLSDQIDLLSLNADIEADRAGKAGKVFARLANETKAMARKTVQAAQGITGDINEIQLTASDALSEIELIRKILVKADQSIAWIAAEIETQSIITKEMAATLDNVVLQGGDVVNSLEQQEQKAMHFTGNRNEFKYFLDQLVESGALLVQNTSRIESLSENLIAVASKFIPAGK